MEITWLGHGSFRIAAAEAVLLVDPWLAGNPMLDDAQMAKAVEGATAILLTHGHFDHTAGVLDFAKSSGLPVYAMVELAGLMEARGATATGFNIGGTVDIGGTKVSMVPAAHSSSIELDGKYFYAGTPCGFVIAEGQTVLYLSGDTGLMADMAWIADYYKPQIGILSAGGHYTMDMAQAAYAAKRWFAFKTLIPCHYKTFPLLEQSADALVAALPDVDVIEPQIMVPLTV